MVISLHCTIHGRSKTPPNDQSRSGLFLATSAPATSIPITLNLHQNVHVLFSEKVDGPLANILKIGTPRSDHVDYSKDGLFLVLMVVVVIVAMTMIVSMTMIVAVTVTMIMAVMTMIMAVMIMRMSMTLGGRSSVVEPELGHCIPDDPTKTAHSSQCLSYIILRISRQG